MKYLCLIYVDEKQLESAPPEKLAAVARECETHTGQLQREGRLIACERLQPVLTATTVRRSGEKVSVTDGPFAETKEQLAGFYCIDAPNLDEAIRIASHIPPGQFGCVEVRPVMTETAPA